jgi:hypothetical protein
MRCHRTALGAVFFGPGAGHPPTHRFDAPDGEYQVVYVGLSYEAALAETVLRNPRRRIVDHVDLRVRSMAQLRNRSLLRLVQAHGPGLSQLGTTAALSTGGYRASRQWSLALWPALRGHRRPAACHLRPDGDDPAAGQRTERASSVSGAREVDRITEGIRVKYARPVNTLARWRAFAAERVRARI